ncbi:MAG: NADH-ubiquinone oxidoreductase chain L [uncultured Acidimicrobiales bacterium]|uniref:NADH-ubiquinone oxidoreductase chain L n=1 Tax=uncultured Acidimicrobiales bacterium TaxID=310071 RepID=A0A6J4I020_9ACTN|nr:MAG: NADH-ubiquinone oxidoreductase chain L [uncultured Acidimicrobiales bacterium]
MLDAVWLIPALPLLGFAILVLGNRRIGEPWAGWLATLMIAGSFVAGAVTFAGLVERPEEERQHVYRVFTWVAAGGLDVDLGFLVDPLSMTMVLFVTGVGTLIHLYSIGYMHGDPGFHRFFAYLNLFAFSMLMLVLGDNLLVTFLGWEGVGACSYLLISFWFTSEANASAGKKAFVTNRIGDVGFMLAMFLSFVTLGTLSYVNGDGTGILENAAALSVAAATGIALLAFVGACGKSAQLPLFVWLPDAMAGPTPVSALIHAATMVTSGVYLLTRLSPVLLQAEDWVPTLIAVVGAATALFAATVAVAQRDIKKVLAYSTVSQLGYMFLAVGSGAYVAAVFHMITHAFFKALLFLGAGSVIHGLHEEQDMRRMGALKRFMPITAATFIVGWLAIAGVPPFAGFWSKDEILLYAYAKHPVLWAVGLVTALLTAFYMSRQVFMVFFGEPRWGGAVDGEHALHEDAPGESEAPSAEVAAAQAADHDGSAGAADHAGHGGVTPHESPWTMFVPLLVLAGLAVVGGGLNLPFEGTHFLADWLHPVVEATEAEIDVSDGTKVALAGVAVVAALLGIAAAALVYLRHRIDARRVEPDVLLQAWHYDQAISAFVGGPGRAGAEAAATADRTGIDGAVNGVATLVRNGGDRLRVVQTGLVRSYALSIAAGAVGLLAYFVVRTGI